MGALLGFIAFIAIIYLLAWLPGHIRQGNTKQLIEVGRAIKRESGFAGNTVILKFKCDNIAPLMQKLQSPHYLSVSNVMMGEFSDSYYYIMSRDKPKWDADVTSKTNDDGTRELTLVFTKWKDVELDPVWGGNANECRTVIERTVLQIDPTAQIATRITKLKNSVLKGGAGMLSTGLHNLAADLQDDELKFTNLATVYASAPPFQGGGPTVQVQAVVTTPQTAAPETTETDTAVLNAVRGAPGSSRLQIWGACSYLKAEQLDSSLSRLVARNWISLRGDNTYQALV